MHKRKHCEEYNSDTSKDLLKMHLILNRGFVLVWIFDLLARLPIAVSGEVLFAFIVPLLSLLIIAVWVKWGPGNEDKMAKKASKVYNPVIGVRGLLRGKLGANEKQELLELEEQVILERLKMVKMAREEGKISQDTLNSLQKLSNHTIAEIKEYMGVKKRQGSLKKEPPSLPQVPSMSMTAPPQAPSTTAPPPPSMPTTGPPQAPSMTAPPPPSMSTTGPPQAPSMTAPPPPSMPTTGPPQAPSMTAPPPPSMSTTEPPQAPSMTAPPSMSTTGPPQAPSMTTPPPPSMSTTEPPQAPSMTAPPPPSMSTTEPPQAPSMTTPPPPSMSTTEPPQAPSMTTPPPPSMSTTEPPQAPSMTTPPPQAPLVANMIGGESDTDSGKSKSIEELRTRMLKELAKIKDDEPE